jgi:hypothetical protein
MNFLIMQILKSRIISNLLSPNILLSTLFSDTLYILSLKSETKYHTHTKLHKIYNLLFQFLCFGTADKKTKGSVLNGSKNFLNLICS